MKSFRFFITALLVMVSATTFAQNITVKGTIVDGATGEPVPGVAVLVKGTTKGVISDVDGQYSVAATADGILSFSSVGYKGVDIAINKRTTINVTLETDAEFLDEVVVTAQGLTRSQKAIGYSTVQIKGEDLTMARQTDLAQTLAGKVSGARFFSSAGSTFDSGAIVLRGTTSYTSGAGSEPIYVVDGTITNKNAVNMDDIENINILKGPAATALYGSQGGNGAVVITTRSAKAGETHIEFSQTTQMEKFYNHTKLQKEYGGGSLGGDAYYYDFYRAQLGISASEDVLSPEFLYDKNDDGSYRYDYYSDESWGARFDKNVLLAGANYWDPTSSQYHKADPFVGMLDLADLFRTGWNNTTNISVSKAGQGYSARFSYTNSDRTGITDNSRAIRRYLTAKTTIQATPWFKATLDYKFTYRSTHNGSSDGYSSTQNPLDDYVQWGQVNVNLKDYKDYMRPDGSWRTWNILDYDDLAVSFHDNPFGLYQALNATSINVWNVISADGEIKLPYNFKLVGKVMANLRQSESETKQAPGSTEFNTAYSQSRNSVNDITFQGRLQWNNTFIQDRLGLDAALFVEQKEYSYGTLSGSTSGGLSIDNWYNLSASNNYVNASNSKQAYKTRSIYGTATVSFDDTFFLDGSLRNDWDSRLPIAHNHYLYGGLSASVMLNHFVKAPWLDFWKLRASAAQVGSTLGTYATTYVFGNSKYNSVGTLSQSSTQLNQAIQPTISTSYEVGTEFRMFKNRIHGDINFYNRDTKNQIMNVTVAPQSGFGSRQINAGLIRNRGIEIEIGGTLVQTRDFSWDADFNISKNVNTLVELHEEIGDSYRLGTNRFYYNWTYDSMVGQPVGAIGVASQWAKDPETGRYIVTPSTSNSQKYQYGDYRPTYDRTEYKGIANFQPDFTGGFSTSFRYKNFNLGMSFDYTVGGQIVSWTNMWGYGSGTLASSSYLNDKGVNVREPLSVGGGVRVDGIVNKADGTKEEVTFYAPAYMYMHNKAYYANDEWIYDRTYLKLREVSFGYNIPRKLLQKANLGLTSANISFVASNPWLIYSAIPNIDPSESGSSWLEGGQSPSTRTFGATLRLVF